MSLRGAEVTGDHDRELDNNEPNSLAAGFISIGFGPTLTKTQSKTAAPSGN